MSVSCDHFFCEKKTFKEDDWFWVTLLLSIVAHTLLFVWLDHLQTESPDASAVAPQRAINVSLNLLQEQLQKKTESKPAPISKPKATKPRKRKIRQKIAKPARQKKPAVKDVKEQSRPAPTPITQEKAAAPRSGKQIQRSHGTRPSLARQHYLSHLLSHIESFKYYPQSARRRGLNGEINVSFELLGTGYINDLSVTGGPLLLRHATRQAVRQALPMPTPPAEVVPPLQVSFVMDYQLH